MSNQTFMVTPYDAVVSDVSHCGSWAEIVEAVPDFGTVIEYEAPTMENPITHEVVTLKDYKVPVNAETREPLGRGVVVGAGQTPFQHSVRGELLDSLRELGCTYKVAGTYRGGLRSIVEMELSEGHFSILRSNGEEDEYRARIGNYGGNDGSAAEVLAHLINRLFCSNQFAALEEDGKLARFRHTLNINSKTGTMQRMIAEAISQAEFQKHTLQRFASHTLSQKDFDGFVVKLITGEDEWDKAAAIWNADMKKGGKSEGRKNFYYDTLTTLFRQGQGNNGRDALDAFNAVTEYCDWCHSQGQGDADAHINRIVHGIATPQRSSTPRPTTRRPSLRLVVDGESEVSVPAPVEAAPIVATDDERNRQERRLTSNQNGAALRLKQRAYHLLGKMVAEAA